MARATRCRRRSSALKTRAARSTAGERSPRAFRTAAPMWSRRSSKCRTSLDIVREETFAPILYTLGYDALDEAIAIQNDVPQGLSSSIFTPQPARDGDVPVSVRIRLRHRQRQYRPVRRGNRRRIRRREGDGRRARERLRRLEGLYAPPDEHGELLGATAACARGEVRFLVVQSRYFWSGLIINRCGCGVQVGSI